MIKDYDLVDLKRANALLDLKETRLLFATKYHRNTDDQPMDFSNANFIKGLYNSIAPDIVVMGGTQIFKSEWLIIDHLAMAYNGHSVFYVLRSFDAKKQYVQGRVNRAIDSVPHYRKLMKESSFDSLDQKQFGRGRIKYVDSGVEANFREYPAASMYVDEVDDCNWNNIEFGMSRMDASIYKFKRFIGNPSVKEGQINNLYQESSKNEYNVPCGACGAFATLNWFKSVVKEIRDDSGNVVDYRLRDTEWERGCGRDIHVVCDHCGGVLQRLSNKGRWIATEEGRKMDGFHIPSLCSPIAGVAELYSEFVRSINNPHLMKIFYNRRLGLPYAATGSKVTSSVMDRCIKDYDLLIHEDRAFIKGDRHDGPCVMGVDVNGTNYDVRVSTPMGGGRRKAVFIGKLDAKRQDELHEIMHRYNVVKCVIDIGPELHLSRMLQEDAKNTEVWLGKFRGSGSENIEKLNFKDNIVSIDKTEVMDRTYAQLTAGKNILPRNFKTILGGEYVAEMCQPTREITYDKSGNPKYSWTSGGKDHQRLADVYDYLAWMIYDSDLIEISSDDIYIA